jgi:NAD(P)-dependent dehydrogenase (short-subunit alcohol dehydrogenase family)
MSQGSPLRVLITGGSSGIGLETARRFGDAGSRVALVARHRKNVEARAGELGHGSIALVGDVARRGEAEACVRRAHEALGGLDVVVNAAGVCMPRALEDMTDEIFEETIAANLTGTFYISRLAGLLMREAGGGSIVNIASELAHMGMGMYAHYCASKVGVVGLTRAMAAELAPKVRVNVISPGPVDTPMLDAELALAADPDLARQESHARVPLKLHASAREVAREIWSLAVDMPFATGSVLNLDGGTTTV